MGKRVVLCLALAVLTVLLALSSCGKTGQESGGSTDYTSVGTGAVTFKFEAFLSDGSVRGYEVSTDEKTVGAALVNAGLIEGENGVFGLYVLTVCGETHKYEEDGKYWAFYINGEYAMTGVDGTDIDTTALYTMKVE